MLCNGIACDCRLWQSRKTLKMYKEKIITRVGSNCWFTMVKCWRMKVHYWKTVSPRMVFSLSCSARYVHRSFHLLVEFLAYKFALLFPSIDWVLISRMLSLRLQLNVFLDLISILCVLCRAKLLAQVGQQLLRYYVQIIIQHFIQWAVFVCLVSGSY